MVVAAERETELTVEAHCDWGLSHDQAWEMGTQKLICLPSEEEMKTLPVDLMPFSQQPDDLSAGA